MNLFFNEQSCGRAAEFRVFLQRICRCGGSPPPGGNRAVCMTMARIFAALAAAGLFYFSCNVHAQDDADDDSYTGDTGFKVTLLAAETAGETAEKSARAYKLGDTPEPIVIKDPPEGAQCKWFYSLQSNSGAGYNLAVGDTAGPALTPDLEDIYKRGGTIYYWVEVTKDGETGVSNKVMISVSAREGRITPAVSLFPVFPDKCYALSGKIEATKTLTLCAYADVPEGAGGTLRYELFRIPDGSGIDIQPPLKSGEEVVIAGGNEFTLQDSFTEDGNDNDIDRIYNYYITVRHSDPVSGLTGNIAESAPVTVKVVATRYTLSYMDTNPAAGAAPLGTTRGTRKDIIILSSDGSEFKDFPRPVNSVLKGWTTMPNYKGKFHSTEDSAALPSVKLTEDTALYAVWSADKPEHSGAALPFVFTEYGKKYAYPKLEAAAGSNPAGSYILMTDYDDADNSVTSPVISNAGGISFTGLFDGNGHTVNIEITNAITYGSAYYLGLFCKIEGGGTVRNLKITGSISDISLSDSGGTTVCAGSVTGSLGGSGSGGKGTIENVVCDANIDIKGDISKTAMTVYAGGVAGYITGDTGELSYAIAAGDIQCHFYAYHNNEGNSAGTLHCGGIAGWNGNGNSISNCAALMNSFDVSAKPSAASGARTEADIFRIAGNCASYNNNYGYADMSGKQEDSAKGSVKYGPQGASWPDNAGNGKKAQAADTKTPSWWTDLLGKNNPAYSGELEPSASNPDISLPVLQKEAA